MMQVYKTDDGLVKESYLMWEFIKTKEQMKEYQVFKSALVKDRENILE